MSAVVAFDKPGDEHLVAEVMSLREVPPITVDEMVSVFGPNWEALSELMRQAARMTPAQAEMAVKAWRIVSSGERDAAWSAVQDAALCADRAAALSAALSVSVNAARGVAIGAAGALVVCDLVGQHGLTPEHIETLLGPWVGVMGYPQGVTA